MAMLLGRGTADHRLGAAAWRKPSAEACSGEVPDLLLLVTQWYRPQLASAVIIAALSSGKRLGRMSQGE